MNEGYPLAAEALDLEAYTLAALIVGSAELRGVEGSAPALARARRTFEFSEVSRRLVSLAVMLRGVLDSTEQGATDVVGELVANVEQSDETSNLTLREACNKIIHAEAVRLSPGPLRENPAVDRRIVLEGEHHGMYWRATLDVITFLECATSKF